MSEKTLQSPDSLLANSANGPLPQNASVDELTAELAAFEKQFPPPDEAAILADCRWLQEHWGTSILEPYRGTHVIVYNGAVVGSGDNALQLELDLARKLHVHPQRLIIAFVDPPQF